MEGIFIVLSILHLLIFSLSFIGLCLFINKRFNVSLFFCPIISLSIESCFLILFGMFIPLNYLAYFIVIVGLSLFAYCLVSKGNKYKYVYCAAMLIVPFLIVLRTKGQFLASQDNFTHWATVIKTMLITNRLPNELDSFINFKTYPLGSSIWAYFVSRIVKDSEGFYMLSKQLIIVYSIMPLFSYLDKLKYKILYISIIIYYLVFASSYQIPINALLVDGLLGVVSLSLYILLTKNKDSFLNVFVAIYLTQIKKSGLLFLIIIYVLILIKDRKIDLKKWVKLILPVVIFLIVWKIHLELSFDNLDVSEQAFSLKLISLNALDKTPSDILTMFKVAVQRIFNFNFNIKYNFIIPTIISIMCLLLFDKKESISFCITINVLYYLYVLLTVLMFIFSMSREEAIVLSCFSRYVLSITLLIIGLFIVFVFNSNTNIKRIIISSLCFFILLFSPEFSSLFDTKHDSEQKRVKFAKSIQYYSVEKGLHYFVVNPNGMDGPRTFTYWSLRYDLWSEYFNEVNKPDGFVLDDNVLDGYQYLIIVDPIDISNQYLHSIGRDELIGMSYVAVDLSNK